MELTKLFSFLPVFPSIEAHRASRALLLLYALALFPLSCLLPGWVSYENGPLENMEVLVLLGGALQSLYFSRLAQDSSTRGMWLPSAGVFLLLALRELSWAVSSWYRDTRISASRSSSLPLPCHTVRRSTPRWASSPSSVCTSSYAARRGSASSAASPSRGSTSRTSPPASPSPHGATATRSTARSRIRSSKKWRSSSCTVCCAIWPGITI